MKPSTRAATLCCACVIALGPAAQALSHTPASGVQRGIRDVASLRGLRFPNRDPRLPVPVSWRRAKLLRNQPGRNHRKDKESGRNGGAALWSVSDPADAAVALWKLAFLSRVALLMAVGGPQCGSPAKPDHVPSTARKRASFFRARKKNRLQNRPRIGLEGECQVPSWAFRTFTAPK